MKEGEGQDFEFRNFDIFGGFRKIFFLIMKIFVDNSWGHH